MKHGNWIPQGYPNREIDLKGFDTSSKSRRDSEGRSRGRCSKRGWRPSDILVQRVIE